MCDLGPRTHLCRWHLQYWQMSQQFTSVAVAGKITIPDHRNMAIFQLANKPILASRTVAVLQRLGVSHSAVKVFLFFACHMWEKLEDRGGNLCKCDTWSPRYISVHVVVRVCGISGNCLQPINTAVLCKIIGIRISAQRQLFCDIIVQIWTNRLSGKTLEHNIGKMLTAF